MVERVVQRLTPSTLRVELRRFEDHYQMSSQVFYDRFRAGDIESPDAPDYMHWAGLCYLAVGAGVLPGATQRRPTS